MQYVTLKSGEQVPQLGMGTWRMGEARTRRDDEVAALKTGLDLGLALVDTAEMYGSGGAEEIVAEALAGRRDEVFLVSKVLPQNASRSGTVKACTASLRRLKTDRIDLYLLHWRGSHPLSDTVAAFEQLRDEGRIRYWGVSNLDVEDMVELQGLTESGHCAANQVLYNVGERGIEFKLLPMCVEQQIAVMAYSPLGQGDLLGKAAVKSLARTHGVSPAAILIAWTLRRPGVISIPKTASAERMRDNAKALDVSLTPDELKELDKTFSPPQRKTPLAMN